MKNILTGAAIVLLLILSITNGFAQKESNKITTAEFGVSGVCNMCKERIENAALIKGVKLVEWDKNTKILKVVYKSNKTDELAIQKAIAEHGHDTEKVKATQEAYEKLPMCCEYRREGAESH